MRVTVVEEKVMPVPEPPNPVLEREHQRITGERKLVLHTSPAPDYVASSRVDLADFTFVPETDKVVAVLVYLDRISVVPVNSRGRQRDRRVYVRDREVIERVPSETNLTG